VRRAQRKRGWIKTEHGQQTVEGRHGLWPQTRPSVQSVAMVQTEFSATGEATLGMNLTSQKDKKYFTKKMKSGKGLKEGMSILVSRQRSYQDLCTHLSRMTPARPATRYISCIIPEFGFRMWKVLYTHFLAALRSYVP
jgi:hypothetical protein